MTEARLASATLANGLVRLAQQSGGFATVLARGDSVSGAVLLQILEKGRFSVTLERMPSHAGASRWMPVGPQDSEKKENFEAYFERRRSRDPDLWIIELDVPDVERFVAELRASA